MLARMDLSPSKNLGILMSLEQITPPKIPKEDIYKVTIWVLVRGSIKCPFKIMYSLLSVNYN